ncbi:helix-turn-helix domain-containing protein [Micromonospora viridifaciens]|uniref:helix-turn-helix domain-containing protein n=1 Tax=Micromonospora viridifaciens TaxID=1881 RepID=UPI000B5AEF12|nr:helix-turn-helix transcriptional regulator [Micromonospora viridifaciens]
MTTVSAEGGTASGPTVLRMLLGAQLRRLREGAGVSRESAGWEIRSSESKISRMELGRVGFKERDIADLLTLYGVTALEERAALLKLARDANSPGWWHRYGDVLPTWFQSYLGLEAAAVLIRTYEVQFVPGLLQTPEYARAVILLGHRGASEAELDRRVSLRVERQRVLRRADPPQLWAVLDEAALRRPIGGVPVMREQLDALIEATAAPHIRLQIVPFDAGGHAAASGAFSILRFGDEDLPDIVYIEQLTSAVYLDKRDDLDHYAVAMERLCVQAAPPERTRELLTRIRDELYPG